MNRIRQAVILALVIAFTGVTMVAQAQYRRPYRTTDRQMEQLLQRIDMRSDRFRTSVDRALDRSRLDNTQREDNINQLVMEFDQAVDQLRDRFNRRVSTVSDLRLVLNQAMRIDNFMQRRRLANNAERDWTLLRNDLNRLVSAYNSSWNWNRRGVQ